MNRTLGMLISCFLLLAGATYGASGLTQYQMATPIQQAFASMQYSAALAYADDDEFGEVNKKTDPSTSTNQPVTGKKSLPKAILLSALVPGAGEWYVGSRTKAKAFFGVEAAIWVGYASFSVYKNWKYDDMIRFGDEFANAQLAGRDDAFLDLVGFYGSIDDYNSLGRATDPERPYLADTPENHWRWQTESAQSSFRQIKNSYREAKRRSDFMLGLAIVNRIVSIVDAVRDVHRHNAQIANDFSSTDGYKFQFSIHPESNTQLQLTILTPF